jgi:hypothetical protein
MERVQPVRERLERVDLARGEPLDGRVLEVERPEIARFDPATVGEPVGRAVPPLDLDGLAGGFEARGGAGRDLEGKDRVARGRKGEGRSRPGEERLEAAPSDARDPPGPTSC